jgi:glycosyltransferase involved in cell wall biosynthesis
MRVDLYAQCWNEEFMLPFFFQHYDRFVDRYVIFDDGSTDRTRDILAAHPRVDLRPLVRAHQDSYVLSQQALADQCWKESRGAADWVIIADADEHLVHPQLRRHLAACTAARVTLMPALGFQMVSEAAPRGGELLCESVRTGAPFAQMMKPVLFDPNAIDEINFAWGRHAAAPTGRVCVPARDEVKLLHFKYLGRAPTEARLRELATRRGQREIANDWCHKWAWSADQLAADWQQVLAMAVDVSAASAEDYPIARWWRPQLPTAAVAP